MLDLRRLNKYILCLRNRMIMLAFSILSLQPQDWFVTLALLPHQHPPGPHEVFKIYKRRNHYWHKVLLFGLCTALKLYEMPSLCWCT